MIPPGGHTVPEPRRPAHTHTRLHPVSMWAASAYCLAVLIALVAGPCLAQTAPPLQRAATIILLDGSNSMNARLAGDKSAKFVSVREALRASLPKISGTEVGFAAFGARRSSDCNDAEVVAPPDKDTGPVLTALETFQPRGFSPVALALRTAAKALPSGVGKSSIVLVLDDLASCRAEDPCAVASGLKRENPALSIHVVVLGPRPADLPTLACVVRQTGGQLFQVADASALAPSIEEVLTIAGVDGRATPASPQAPALVSPPQPATQQRAPAKAATPKPLPDFDPTQPGVHLTARLSEGAPALLLPTSWRVWKVEVQTTETGEATRTRDPNPIIENTAPTLSRRLPNGQYEVEARTGLVSARKAFEVTSEAATLVPVDLNAALLTISAPQSKGAPPAPETRLEVQSLGSNPAPVWIASAGAHDLVVPPGSYRVTAVAGLATAERVLTVGPGVSGQAEMPLDAGRLVVEETSGAASRSQVTIEADDPDATDGRREIYRAVSGRLELALPAGSYLVTVRSAGAEARDRVQIRAGETVRRTGAVASAQVKLVSRIGQALPQGVQVTYRIERIDIPTRPMLRWSDGEAPLELTPGRYRIEARVGSQNAATTREIDVRPGPAEQRVELDTGAGSITLRLAGTDRGLGLGEVYWQIFSDSGAAIWRTGEAEPLLSLIPGRYRVRADTRERTLENTIEVKPGETRLVEIGG